MSNREKCISILDGFSEVQLLNVAAILENIKYCMEEAEDDAFCDGLYQSYLADPEKGNPIPLEDFAREMGVEMLPETEQGRAYELVKRLVLAWDPDFTKLTPSEAAELHQAELEYERGETVRHEDIDWD